MCYGGDLLQSFIVSIQANPSYIPISPSRQGFLKVSVLDGINGIERENTTFNTETRLGLHLICDATFSLENSCAIYINIINISYISHLFNKILTVYKMGRLLECVPLCEVQGDMDRPLILTEGASLH